MLSPREGFYNLAVGLYALNWAVVWFFPPAPFCFSSGASFSILAYTSVKIYFQSSCKLTLQRGTLMKYVPLRRILSLLQTTVAILSISLRYHQQYEH